MSDFYCIRESWVLCVVSNVQSKNSQCSLGYSSDVEYYTLIIKGRIRRHKYKTKNNSNNENLKVSTSQSNSGLSLSQGSQTPPASYNVLSGYDEKSHKNENLEGRGGGEEA